jgi:heme/copper-type cytochrome/quinol oxidase subunit 2
VPPPPVAPTGPGTPAGYGYPAQAPGYPNYPNYPGPGYQGTPPYGWSAAPVVPQNGMGVAALVLGIISCCLFCAYGVVSLVLGILAVVFGVKGRRKAERGEADNHTQAQAGLVLGSIGIVLGLAMITFLIVVGVLAADADSDDDSLYGDTLRAAPTARLIP